MEKQPGCEETNIQSHLALDAPSLSAGSGERSDVEWRPREKLSSRGNTVLLGVKRANTGKGNLREVT